MPWRRGILQEVTVTEIKMMIHPTLSLLPRHVQILTMNPNVIKLDLNKVTDNEFSNRSD